jgi:hypothetical protein
MENEHLIYRVSEWNKLSTQVWCINRKTNLIHYAWHTQDDLSYIESTYAIHKLVDKPSNRASEKTMMEIENSSKKSDRETFVKVLKKVLSLREQLNAIIENDND